jgi:hypothetical protein
MISFDWSELEKIKEDAAWAPKYKEHISTVMLADNQVKLTAVVMDIALEVQRLSDQMAKQMELNHLQEAADKVTDEQVNAVVDHLTPKTEKNALEVVL